ncbi:24301_t:CDS:2, partial [Racocetra persica]
MWLALFLAILPAISLNIQKVAIITEVGTKIDKSLLGKVLPDRANSSSSLFKDPVNEHAASFFAIISFKPEEIALINLPEDKGAIETTLDLASEFLPGSKLLLKAGKKFATAVGKTAGGLAKGVGMVKDLAADISLGNLSTSVGNLKDGLAQAQGEIESKSQELTENIHQLRAELERQKEDLANQLKSQESRLETRLVDEIRQQEAKITQLQAETKKQLVEEQKKLLEAAIQKLEAAQQNINRTTQGQIQATEAKLAEFNQELDRVKDEQKEEMENIKQEVNQRMDQLEGKTEQALQLAQQTSQRVEALAAQMAKTQDKVAKLEKQVQQNQQAIQQAREEVQRTNQRLDDFIKRQELMDFSAQQLVFDKIQKTLANKAEEAKLLATLNLLEETKSLLPEEEIPVAGAKTANQPVISLLQSLISALEGQES